MKIQPFIIMLIVSLLLPISAPHRAQAQLIPLPCDTPEGYLDNLFDDLGQIGTDIGQVETDDPAALSLFYVELYQLRHRYENLTLTLPDCALRGHSLFIHLLSNWADIVGLALAANANPAAAEQYIAEIETITERIDFFTPILLDLFFPPPPPTLEPATETPVPVLSTFYVNTLGLNVRGGPGSDFPSVGVLTGGTAVQIIGLDTLPNNDVWYQIVFPESPDGTGWVFGQLLSPEIPEEFPEPIPTSRLPTATPRPSATPTPRP